MLEHFHLINAILTGQKVIIKAGRMTANLLSIAETSQEIQIDGEKLRFIHSKVNIWDHFGISKS